MEKERNWKNSKYGKLIRTLLIFAALIAVAGMYKSVELQNRAIVLGLGIDYFDGGYEITAEVISPSASKGGGGSGAAKIVTGNGATVAAAMQDIYRTTGKLPSLGQTSILVMGEGMSAADAREPLSLFQSSDAFKDGVPLASCKGTAKELFQSVTPVDSIISFALQRIISGSAKSTGTPSNNICSFLENQTHGAKASFVCRIEPDGTGAKSKGQEDGDGKPETAFDCTKLDVFREGKYISTVEKEAAKGFVLLKQNTDGLLFVVGGAEADAGFTTLTAKVNSKKIKSKFSLKSGTPYADFEIEVKVRQVYADNGGLATDLLPAYRGAMPAAALNEAEKQILDTAFKGVQNSVGLNCDYYNFYQQFYAALGKQWKDYAQNNPDYLSKIQFGFAVKVAER